MILYFEYLVVVLAISRLHTNTNTAIQALWNLLEAQRSRKSARKEVKFVFEGKTGYESQNSGRIFVS